MSWKAAAAGAGAGAAGAGPPAPPAPAPPAPRRRFATGAGAGGGKGARAAGAGAHACAVTGAGLAPGGQQAQPNKWPAFRNAKGLSAPGGLGGGSLKPLAPLRSHVVRDAALVGPDLRSEGHGHRVAGPHVVGGGARGSSGRRFSDPWPPGRRSRQSGPRAGRRAVLRVVLKQRLILAWFSMSVTEGSAMKSRVAVVPSWRPGPFLESLLGLVILRRDPSPHR